jgi:hypothetical protein
MQKTQKICFICTREGRANKIVHNGGASTNFSRKEEYSLLSEKKEDSLVLLRFGEYILQE